MAHADGAFAKSVQVGLGAEVGSDAAAGTIGVVKSVARRASMAVLRG